MQVDRSSETLVKFGLEYSVYRLLTERVKKKHKNC